MLGWNFFKKNKEMLWLRFVNDGTGTEKIVNYDWDVGINKTILFSGRVEGHPRCQGWVGLVRRAIKNYIKSQFLIKDE